MILYVQYLLYEHKKKYTKQKYIFNQMNNINASRIKRSFLDWIGGSEAMLLRTRDALLTLVVMLLHAPINNHQLVTLTGLFYYPL